MPADEPVLRAARNAFGALLVGLLAIGVYQFVTAGAVANEVAVSWLGGVVVYLVSLSYYRRVAGEAD